MYNVIHDTVYLLAVLNCVFISWSQDGFTALMEASKNGHPDIVTLLLGSEGIDVNVGNKVD